MCICTGERARTQTQMHTRARGHLAYRSSTHESSLIYILLHAWTELLHALFVHNNESNDKYIFTSKRTKPTRMKHKSYRTGQSNSNMRKRRYAIYFLSHLQQFVCYHFFSRRIHLYSTAPEKSKYRF